MPVDIIYLDRFCHSVYGVFGELRFHATKVYTVERPWADNQRNVSCIPSGVYPLKLTYHIRGDYATYEVCDVPGRSAIKIDIANTMDELRGCVAVGTSLGWSTAAHKWCVRSSRDAHKRFMAQMNGVPEAVLCIRNITPEA